MNPFKYLARDLLTWAPLDPLPYQGVTFGKVLDQHGPWSGKLPLPQMWDAATNTFLFDWKDATRTSRTALFVDLQGTLVWGGILWTTNYESDDQTHSLAVGATEFGSYYQHRLQADNYEDTWPEPGEDPMKIIRRVIEDAQAAEVAPRKVIVGPTTGSLTEEEIPGPGYITGSKIPIVLHGPEGFDVFVQYPGTSLQTIDSINSTLTQIGYGPGYDFSWDVEYLPGTNIPAVQLNLYRPLKGRTAEESGIVILAGDTVKWTWPEDGSEQATEVTETGSGTGGLEPAHATANYPGYPLSQKATARTQITTEGLLEIVALGDLALYGYPVVSPVIVLAASLPDTPAQERKTLALGEYDVGDRFTFKVTPMAQGGPHTDYRFPEGMECELRINAWTCTPADHGLSTVQLTCGPPPLGYVPPPQLPH
jgi:hypothetical protein